MTIKECAIGVIGLGQMGAGIAANLVKAGFDVTVYDLQQERVERLVELGGRGGSQQPGARRELRL